VSRGATQFVDVEKATVVLLRKGRRRGQGVLVNGNLIVTAAHCVTFSIKGGMALRDYYIEEIKTKDGAVLKVRPIAIEPLSDIAVLGGLDDQEFPEEVVAFEDFCEHTKGVPLFKGTWMFEESFKVYVYTHEGNWLEGKATNWGARDESSFWLETDEPIKGGTSGSPIINEEGELVGVVCNAPENVSPSHGSAPRPHLTLPTWICRQIESAEGR